MTTATRPLSAALLPAVEQCPISIVITDKEGAIEYVNPWFTRSSGYEFSEVVGKNPRLLKSGVTATSEYAEMYRTLLRKQVWKGEFCNKRKDGTLFWESVVMVPVLDAAGEITHFMSLKEDITAQKSAERSQTSMMALLHWRTGAARVSVVVDAEGGNTSIAATTGELPHEITPAQVLRYPFVHSGELLGRVELEFVSQRVISDKDQLYFKQMVSTVAVALAKFAAVEARLRAEQRSRVAQKMEAIGQLAGGIAHDYNNILTATLLHLALARGMPDLPPQMQETLVELEAEAKRAARLTRQLLLFSRRQLGSFELVELRSVVEQLLTMLNRVLGEQVTLEVPKGENNAWIEADTGMIEQVIVNLCVNARDALGEHGGFIHMRVQITDVSEQRASLHARAKAGTFVCLSVADSGCGMDEATKARLFEPFFTTKEPGRGTGLGLATVYGIVERHHGWIECDSEVGVGTEFRVFLPLREKPAPAARVASMAPGMSAARPLVMLVEDDPMVRATAASALRLHGCEVLDVPDGAAAIELWPKVANRVQLVMSDMVLPGGVTGKEVIQRCLSDRPGISAILTSGHFDSHTLEQMKPLGKVTFLPKPYEFANLVDMVTNAVNSNGREH